MILNYIITKETKDEYECTTMHKCITIHKGAINCRNNDYLEEEFIKIIKTFIKSGEEKDISDSSDIFSIYKDKNHFNIVKELKFDIDILNAKHIKIKRNDQPENVMELDKYHCINIEEATYTVILYEEKDREKDYYKLQIYYTAPNMEGTSNKEFVYENKFANSIGYNYAALLENTSKVIDKIAPVISNTFNNKLNISPYTFFNSDYTVFEYNQIEDNKRYIIDIPLQKGEEIYKYGILTVWAEKDSPIKDRLKSYWEQLHIVCIRLPKD